MKTRNRYFKAALAKMIDECVQHERRLSKRKAFLVNLYKMLPGNKEERDVRITELADEIRETRLFRHVLQSRLDTLA